MAETRVQLCGELIVEIEGERLESALRGRQGRLLFAYLVLNRGRPVRRDELIEAVWSGDGARGSGDSVLAPPLSRLRKALGAGRIEGRENLSLRLPEGAWVDWEVAQASLDEARAALVRGEVRQVLEAAREAARIAGLGLLPGLEADWIDENRRDLDALRVEALELVASAGTAVGGGELPAAEQAARAAVEAEPFRESARAALMEVLWARGNVAEAMRAYEDVRTLLRDELGTAPGPRLVELHERLLSGAAAPEPVAGPAPATERRAPGPHVVEPAKPIFERERELATLATLVDGAAIGDGRMALIEGPAGIGKSRLLMETRTHAAAGGAITLTARGSELEREFPFGAVRQLFETAIARPDDQERLFAGAAAPARAIFEGLDAHGAAAGEDASFAVLHGLFWLTLNVAGDRSVVLAIDDLQWCDAPSQRFVSYLVRRLEGLPVLVIATVRTGDPAADSPLLGEIARDPLTVPLRPGPLSEDATTKLVRERLDEDADPRFCAACRDATGGNPLLLHELLLALEVDGVAPTAASIGVVQTIGPRAVSPSVLHRLARLPSEAETVARALAVLGEGADLTAVAALAGLDDQSAAEATAMLSRADIVRPEPPLGFVHPLVRDAVYSDLPPGERELHHARAARVLADRGAEPEAVATHLLASPRRGDPWVVDMLEQAGRSATQKGAPESAIAYLRRATEEPPPAERRPYVMRDLGIAETGAMDTSAAERLRIAYSELENPRDRALVAYAQVQMLLFSGHPDEAVEIGRRAIDHLPAELADFGLTVQAAVSMARYFGATLPPDLAEDLVRYRTEPLPATTGAAALKGVVAYEWARAGGPAQSSAQLAAEAVAERSWLPIDQGFVWTAASVALTAADREEGLLAMDAMLQWAHRSGSMFAYAGGHLWRGFALLRRGDLAEAEEALVLATEFVARWGSGVAPPYPGAFLTQTRLERGDLVAARDTLERVGPDPVGGEGTRYLLVAHAELLLAEGRPEEALAVVDELGARVGNLVNPAVVRWRSLKAEALHALGRSAEALPFAQEELDLARAYGAPGTLSMALRVLGTAQGERGLPHLEEAVEAVRGSSARLQHAKALAALGAAYRRAGRAVEAQYALGRGLELAEICDARRVAELIRSEMLEAGLEPSSEPASGLHALAGGERRMVELAAEGLSEREIAQALFVTPKTVENRLAAAFQKLGVDSPRELPRVLAEA